AEVGCPILKLPARVADEASDLPADIPRPIADVAPGVLGEVLDVLARVLGPLRDVRDDLVRRGAEQAEHKIERTLNDVPDGLHDARDDALDALPSLRPVAGEDADEEVDNP